MADTYISVLDGASKADPSKLRPSARSFGSSLYRVLKTVRPDAVVTTEAVSILNSLVHDVIKLIAEEAGQLISYNSEGVVTMREIQTSMRLIFPDALAKAAMSEGTKAIAKYTQFPGEKIDEKAIAVAAAYSSDSDSDSVPSLSQSGADFTAPPKPKRESAKPSVSERAGLHFPVGRIHRMLTEMKLASGVRVGAAVYLSAVLEFFSAQVLVQANDASLSQELTRIGRQHLPIKSKDELKNLKIIALPSPAPVSPVLERASMEAAPSAYTPTPSTSQTPNQSSDSIPNISSSPSPSPQPLNQVPSSGFNFSVPAPKALTPVPPPKLPHYNHDAIVARIDAISAELEVVVLHDDPSERHFVYQRLHSEVLALLCIAEERSQALQTALPPQPLPVANRSFDEPPIFESFTFSKAAVTKPASPALLAKSVTLHPPSQPPLMVLNPPTSAPLAQAPARSPSTPAKSNLTQSTADEGDNDEGDEGDEGATSAGKGPKNPRTAYNFYCSARTAEAKSKGAKAPAAKQLGEAWKKLTNSDKAPYEEMAKQDKVRYANEVAAVK